MGLLLIGWVWGACASGGERRNPNALDGGGGGAQKSPPDAVQRAMNLWKPRLGSVVLVNSAAGFALIDIGTAPAPVVGTGLRAFSLDQEATRKLNAPPPPPVEMVVSAFQRRPFLIADLKGGVPRVGDFVVAIDRSERTEPGKASQSASTPKTPAESWENDSGLRASRSPSGQTQAVGEGGVEAENSAGVIPGIAPRAGGGIPK